MKRRTSHNAAAAAVAEPAVTALAPFTEALSERTSIATGYPSHATTTGARLAVTIRAPGERVTGRTSVLVRVEQSDGPDKRPNEIDVYAEDLELLVAVLAHAIREARASGTIPSA